MILREHEIYITKEANHDDLIDHFKTEVLKKIQANQIPIRFVVTKTDDSGYRCEIGIACEIYDNISDNGSIFDFKKRQFENTSEFNAVLIIPTGIGAEIGGHSGDAGPIARLLSSCCDNLITHPNVVNASDINELPENGLYVEGSILTRLIMGTIALQKVRSNRVLLIIDDHDDNIIHESAINAASAARAAFGLDVPIVVKMKNRINMHSLYSSTGRAVGRIDYFERLQQVIDHYNGMFDAIALSSVIRIPENMHIDYYIEDIINPWGGVEAMLTHAISTFFNYPSAHSPMIESKDILNLEIGVVDPRKAAEVISVTFLHSILKGLHRSPKILLSDSIQPSKGLITVNDISCLVIPDGCVGLPTLAAIAQNIPVIAVRENKNKMANDLSNYPFDKNKLFIVENYLEAAGLMTALKSGVDPKSVRRPIHFTNVEEFNNNEVPNSQIQTTKISEVIHRCGIMEKISH